MILLFGIKICKMVITYLKHLPKEKKDKARKILTEMRDRMIEQNKNYHELFIKPNEIVIEIINSTLKPNPYTKRLTTLEECKQAIEKTATRYKNIHKLFRRKNGKKNSTRKC